MLNIFKHNEELFKLKTNTTEKIWKLLIAVILIVPFLANIAHTQTVQAASLNATIEIHKKKMTTLPDPLIQNTGNKMTDFDQYDGLADVEFKAYDVSTEFYNERAAGKTVDEAKAAVQGLAPQSAPVKTGTTDASGNLTFATLPKKSGSQDAVYLIIETPKAGVVSAANLVVGFPVYELIKQADNSYKYGDVELDTVHLYPKNTVTTNGAVKLTKTGTAENQKLDGAEFVISKVEGGVTKYITGVKDGLYVWGETQANAKHFVTGKNYAIGNNAFVEVVGTTGELLISGLEQGNYKTTEVKAPDNTAMITAETTKDFAITAGTTVDAPAAVAVKNDTINVQKTTPKLNGQDVAVGDKIQYEITTNIPQGIADKEGSDNKYTQFNLIDTHDESLTFDNVTTGGNAYALYDGNNLIAASNYTVTETTNGFTVAVTPSYIPSLTPNGTLKFVYYMYLNEKADPTKGFKNEANVTNNKTTTDKTPPTVEIHTGGKRFVKIDGDVSSDKTLQDAEFVVRDADADSANYLAIDPVTKAVTWVADYTSATKYTTGTDGLVDIKGLKYGTYFLEETKAPNNYVKLTSRKSFVVDKDSYGTTSLVAPEKVPNKHKGTLPATGGMGILAFIIGGLVIVGGAVFYFKRRSNQVHNA